MKVLPWLLLMAVGLAGWFYWPEATVIQQPGRIDTVYVDKPLPILRIDTVDIGKPYQVTVYLPDTAARRRAEQQEIMTSVEITNGLLSLSKLTPKGIGIKQEYHLPELAAIRIDGTGNVQITEDKKLKRKLFWRKVKRTAVIVGATAAGLLVGKSI